MTLIEKIKVDEIDVSFYNGIDIDFVINHPKDGSSGFIFCFIDNWVKDEGYDFAIKVRRGKTKLISHLALIVQ